MTGTVRNTPLTASSSPSSFRRSFDAVSRSILKQSGLFSNHLHSDIHKGIVFPAVRRDVVDFYYEGGRLFAFSKGIFATHAKYAAAFLTDKDYITEADLQAPGHIRTFDDPKAYPRIKENCARYAGVEAAGVAALWQASSYATRSQPVVVLDIEVALYDEMGRERVDVLLFHTEEKSLRFVEVKHFSNGELWRPAGTRPPVACQVERYIQRVQSCEAAIVAAYQDYVSIVNDLFHLQLPFPTGLEPEPVCLFVFGFDKNQRDGRLQELLLQDGSLKGIPYYGRGGLGGIDLKSLWNARAR